MQQYLVTGGCGFIGSHLCAALIGRGHAVRVLDDLSTGSVKNLARGATLIEGTIIDRATLAEALVGIDGCFHLAAIASVERARQDWVDTHRVNLTGTIMIFEELARQRLRTPVVYASSAAVYGDCSTLPIVESAEKLPLSAYGADKYACELQARVASHVHGIPTTGLRFFNVFGPRQDPNSPYSGVISIFCDRLRRGLPITIYGDGRQTRDFIYVGDVVAALISAMRGNRPEPAVFNVCTGQPTSVLDVARTIGALYQRTPELCFRPERAGEIKHSYGSPARLYQSVVETPTTALNDGLQDVLNWLESSQPVEHLV